MKDKIYWTYEDISIKNRKLLHKNVIVDSNKGKYYKPVYYYDSINTFDIETTTIKDAERPFAFMYIWQFCLDNDRVYMGRTWQDFRKFIKALKKKLRLSPSRRLIVYIHNLSYEFQFMKDFFEIYEVFQIGPHKFLSVLAEGIEFRCSYLLTNMNLDKLCKNTPTCTHNKLSGQTYNYTKIRTPFSIISDEELEYCYNDVKGLAECLEYRLHEDNLVTIPKTSTGFVRRDTRSAMQQNKNNYIIFKETALTPFLYRLNRLAFRGGDTHGNSLYTRQVIYNIKSRDIKSSYPASLLINTYPMGPFEEVDPVWYMSNFAELQKTTCALISVTYKDIEYAAPDNMPYIPASKCFELTDCTYDNGRVKSASFLSMALTDIDYKIIEGTYKYSEKIINKVFMADRGYLPAEFRETVIEYFRNKTRLDGIKESKFGDAIRDASRINLTKGEVETVHGEIIDEDVNEHKPAPNDDDVVEVEIISSDYKNNPDVNPLRDRTIDDGVIQSYNDDINSDDVDKVIFKKNVDGMSEMTRNKTIKEKDFDRVIDEAFENHPDGSLGDDDISNIASALVSKAFDDVISDTLNKVLYNAYSPFKQSKLSPAVFVVYTTELDTFPKS